MNDAEPMIDWDEVSGRNDPNQRYRIYRRCPGEKEPELVATCPDESSVGTVLCQLGREGEFAPENGDCLIGILDTQGEVGKKWLVRPWLANGVGL